MRIEDTDRERYVADAVANILKSLNWAGLSPDEGVVMGEEGKIGEVGENGPYTQSERLPIYRKHVNKLLEAGHAYYCFCTTERLTQLREEQTAKKLPTGYDGQCLSLGPTEAKKRAEGGEKCVVRLKMPKTGETVFTDLIHGEIRFKNELIDDQVLIKSDGYPTYHFAVVVDDHLMEITHVIRGDEWISSLPKHLQIYKYFGWEVPQMAHLSLLLNSDKSKLSKRQGDVAVDDYIKKGYLPEALINFVAFLGWNPGTEKEMYSLDELVQDFDLSKAVKTGAVFNGDKLDWFNKQYIKLLSNAQLVEISMPWVNEQLTINKEQIELLTKAVALEKERITVLSELPNAIKFIFDLPDYAADLLVWKKSSAEEVKKILPTLAEFMNTISVQDWNKEKLEQKIGEWIAQMAYSTGSVLWPMRASLSGQDKSPGPFEIAEVLGKDESLNRLHLAIKKLS